MLNSSSCADSIWSNFSVSIGLNLDGSTSGGNIDGSGYPAMFATEYDKYAKEGVVLGADNGAEDKSILQDALGKSTTVTELATAFADYWATVFIVPGDPAHGGTAVISVVNDAASKVSLFESAIQESITSSKSEPFFYQFINNIETMAVSSIIWTVTEMMPTTPPSPSSFPETIT